MIQISYLGYCQLGGAANPRLMSRTEYLGGRYYQTTYWLRQQFS